MWRNARMSWHSLHTNNQRKIIFKGVGERIRKEKKKKREKKRLLIYKAFLAGGGLR